MREKPPDRPHDLKYARLVQQQLEIVDKPVAGKKKPLRERLDNNPGFQNLSDRQKARLRGLVTSSNPQQFNHARVAWSTRTARELEDDVRLAARQSARVEEVMKAMSEQACRRDVSDLLRFE